MEQTFQSLRLVEVWEEILYLVRNPYSNIGGALLLLAVVVITVLLLASVAILVATRPKRRKRANREELEYYLSYLDRGIHGESEESIPAYEEGGPPYRTAAWVGGALLVGLVLWIAVGFTSASSAVCTSCHVTNPHADVVEAGGFDPHASVDCVRCHESSNWFALVTADVPSRVVHFGRGMMTEPQTAGYGYVVSRTCLQCHGVVRTEITEDAERGVRMSHKEPLEAGAECRDCHTLDSGVITAVTVGMAPCLRCHDGQDQSSECSLCHTKDVGAATRPQTNLAEMVGQPLIPTPDCGGCHNQASQCDPCHGGVRMPHTEVFLWWGHAREGVKDIWYNDGERCGRCHTAERRPCTRCHAFFPGHPVDFFEANHGAAGNTGGCDACHNRRAYVAGRDLCELCHGEPVVTQ